MPDIVAKGREETKVWACSYCHLAHGRGRPENASVSGLPVSYFVQTMADYKNGNRKSSDPRKRNANLMIGFAKAMTDAEVRAAARILRRDRVDPAVRSRRWTPYRRRTS